MPEPKKATNLFVRGVEFRQYIYMYLDTISSKTFTAASLQNDVFDLFVRSWFCLWLVVCCCLSSCVRRMKSKSGLKKWGSVLEKVPWKKRILHFLSPWWKWKGRKGSTSKSTAALWHEMRIRKSIIGGSTCPCAYRRTPAQLFTFSWSDTSFCTTSNQTCEQQPVSLSSNRQSRYTLHWSQSKTEMSVM